MTQFDRLVEQGAPASHLKEAITYLNSHRPLFPNHRFIALVDFSKDIGQKRLLLVDLEMGTIRKFQVTHGAGSDPDLTGYAKKFSDLPNSGMSSLGFYRTLSAYLGFFGYSLRLQGLSSSNQHVEARSIVMHPFWVGPNYRQSLCRQTYLSAGLARDQKFCLPSGALTLGCFGVAPTAAPLLVDALKGGALIYAFR